MLTIRTAQLDTLDRAAASRFAAAIAASLRADHADLVAGLSEADLLGRVHRGIAIAEAYGLDREVALALFVRLLFVLGPGFDLHQAVRPILEAADGEPEERLVRLMRDLPPESWGAVVQVRDEAAWQVPRRGEPGGAA
jgi:hypothetical protein